MTREDIMSTDEICELLGIQRITLYSKKWRRSTGVPVYRQGKYLFARKNEFIRWYNGRIKYE